MLCDRHMLRAVCCGCNWTSNLLASSSTAVSLSCVFRYVCCCFLYALFRVLGHSPDACLHTYFLTACLMGCNSYLASAKGVNVFVHAAAAAWLSATSSCVYMCMLQLRYAVVHRAS